MLTTSILAVVFGSLTIGCLGLWVWGLRRGLKWANVNEVTKRQIALIVVVVFGGQIFADLALRAVNPRTSMQDWGIALMQFAVVFVFPSIVICAILKTSFGQAIRAWLPTVLVTIFAVLLTYFVVRPFVFEAYVLPTNSMAPTLAGRHWRGECPRCGKPTYCSPRDFGESNDEPTYSICENFHVVEGSVDVGTIHDGDRIMVAKFLAPRRWDLVVFRFPEDPTTIYVSRLVGLPGERIEIREGAVCVDGERLTLPPSLEGIEYLSELPWEFGPKLWGSDSRPADLGEDEYFVLGDFSRQARDSRLWERGASGHHPYAVPRSHIQGVVTHTYWPLTRRRVHR